MLRTFHRKQKPSSRIMAPLLIQIRAAHDKAIRGHGARVETRSETNLDNVVIVSGHKGKP